MALENRFLTGIRCTSKHTKLNRPNGKIPTKDCAHYRSRCPLYIIYRWSFLKEKGETNSRQALDNRHVE